MDRYNMARDVQNKTEMEKKLVHTVRIEAQSARNQMKSGKIIYQTLCYNYLGP